MALPLQTFDGEDLYPGIATKAAVLGFAIIQNHPFVDGNKRVGHAALETTLFLNGLELAAEIDAAEAAILDVAAGKSTREEFQDWIHSRVAKRER